MSEDFQEWIEQNYLDCSFIEPQIFEITGAGKFLLLTEKDGKVIDINTYSLILSEDEYALGEKVDYLAFKFGKNYYYSDVIETPKLQELRYLGKIKSLYEPIDFPFVGIHGGFDLCNGSRTYKDWCKKAKFLGLTAIGICEENTLAGVISFQNACKKEEIRSIIGESVIIDENGTRFSMKLYCKDRETGWKNLLQINTLINVKNKGFVKLDEIIQFSEGLICIIPTTISLSKIYDRLKNSKFELYYQLDFSEWESQDKDKECIFNLEDYIKNYKHELKPVLVSDAYFLEKSHSKIRKVLSLIQHSNFKNYSDNLFFKSIDDFYLQAMEIISDENFEKYEILMNEAIQNTIQCFDGVGFQVVTGNFYLPQYEMSEEETELYVTKEALLLHYIEKGLEEKVIQKGLDVEIYLERIEKEFDVIQRGGFIDYFLILCDVYRFCDENNIWYGVGRGSAAGCLIAYLSNIVSIDPIQYGLIFERFLNEGRISKVEQVEVIVINSQDENIEFDLQEKLIILRDEKEETICAAELREGDRIIRSKSRTFK